MKPERILTVHDVAYEAGPVVYWMNRDNRAEDNWALLHAQEQARTHHVPLLVLYNLDVGFLGGGYRQHVFKLQGLEAVEKSLQKKNIPFTVVVGGVKEVVTFLESVSAGYLVTDFSPLKIQRKWVNGVAKKFKGPFEVVDTHNIIPPWITSQKQEYAARTIRPKVYRLIEEYLEEFPALKKQKIPYDNELPAVDWVQLRDVFPDKEVIPVEWITAGERAARKHLDVFLEEKLSSYAEDRNNALVDGQSNLSPYIHYGHIAPQRIALEVVKKVNKKITNILHKERNGASTANNASAFLEEMIIRRELSDNFCWYNKDYDSVKSFPDWAQKTLETHTKDERQYVYTKKQFENADTHDPLWNAAQKEMVQTGKMHGYMRMYWAKKILEWTKGPQEAMKMAIYLNDKYSLDGRDPNGYAGIAWSIGGVHDRPWFERPIFGTVRYMAESGVKKRFNIDAYIKKWLQNSLAV